LESCPRATSRFRITATPTAGGTPYVFITGASTSITITTPTSAPLADYSPNDEFGDPTTPSASTPNDFLITRPQYVISYNQSHGTPNWVAYELDNRQFGYVLMAYTIAYALFELLRSFDIDAFSWDRGGRYLAGGNADGTVTVWDAKGKRLGRHDAPAPHEIAAVRFTPDGSLLVCAGTKTPVTRPFPYGPEDLTVWRERSALWSVTEFPGRRTVFGVEI